MFDQEFIDRCKSPEWQEKVNKHYKESNFKKNKWQRENPELQRKCVKNYSNTEKGKYSNSKRNVKRKKYMKYASLELSWQEKIDIGKFYKNCPIGYQVDHIIPISKGGKHSLSNLQYLTSKENAMKGNKLQKEFEEYIKFKLIYDIDS